MPDGLLTALGIALDQLQDRAVASLVLPSQGTELGRGMTDPDPFEPSRLIAVSVALRTTIPPVLFSFVRKKWRLTMRFMLGLLFGYCIGGISGAPSRYNFNAKQERQSLKRREALGI